MGMFGQMGDMYKLQKEAKRIKKELEKTHIFSEDNNIKVIVNGSQEIVKIEFLEGAKLEGNAKLGDQILAVTNKAMKKSQQLAAEKMKPLMGSMGMGGA